MLISLIDRYVERLEFTLALASLRAVLRTEITYASCKIINYMLYIELHHVLCMNQLIATTVSIV